MPKSKNSATTDVVLNFIYNQTSFNGLYAIQGALAGFYTSPLLKEYGVLDILQAITSCDQEVVTPELNKQFCALNEANKQNMRTVGVITRGGIRIPTVEFAEATIEQVELIRTRL